MPPQLHCLEDSKRKSSMFGGPSLKIKGENGKRASSGPLTERQ
jgi:hypothetical protein